MAANSGTLSYKSPISINTKDPLYWKVLFHFQKMSSDVTHVVSVALDRDGHTFVGKYVDSNNEIKYCVGDRLDIDVQNYEQPPVTLIFGSLINFTQ